MRVGIVYDLFEDYPWREGDPLDSDSENEPPETLHALESALKTLGHIPVRLGSPLHLSGRLSGVKLDAAINIAEGAHSRNREAYAPILLELAGIPYIGSDALTLSLSLDKSWSKDLVRAAGIATPDWSVVPIGSDVEVSDLEKLQIPDHFPLFVKPRYEGSAMGISRASRVEDEEELRAQVRHVQTDYSQDALVEVFIPGSEYTVSVTGNSPPLALPVLQRAVDASSGIGLHALDRRTLKTAGLEWDLPSVLTPDLEAELQAAAITVYRKLECLDFARMDFRVDPGGKIWFLEINPLPTFAPDGTFAILAELSGNTYPEFLAEVLDTALNRVVRENTAV
jgi:D-alanine-D-alanine ligase